MHSLQFYKGHTVKHSFLYKRFVNVFIILDHRTFVLLVIQILKEFRDLSGINTRILGTFRRYVVVYYK